MQIYSIKFRQPHKPSQLLLLDIKWIKKQPYSIMLQSTKRLTKVWKILLKKRWMKTKTLTKKVYWYKLIPLNNKLQLEVKLEQLSCHSKVTSICFLKIQWRVNLIEMAWIIKNNSKIPAMDTVMTPSRLKYRRGLASKLKK